MLRPYLRAVLHFSVISTRPFRHFSGCWSNNCRAIKRRLHIISQAALDFCPRAPSSWKLFANDVCIASGSGAFARECFCEGAEVFLDLCRDAVRAAKLHQWSQREYELLSAAAGSRWRRQTEAALRTP